MHPMTILKSSSNIVHMNTLYTCYYLIEYEKASSRSTNSQICNDHSLEKIWKIANVNFISKNVKIRCLNSQLKLNWLLSKFKQCHLNWDRESSNIIKY